MIAREGIPAQTVAPKFTGRFNKGVDYVGDLARVREGVRRGPRGDRLRDPGVWLPDTLKLSVHSGSDKFSLYPIINRLRQKTRVRAARQDGGHDLAGGGHRAGRGGRRAGLRIAQEIYAGAYGRFDELTGPYATVIDVKKERLPDPEAVAGWSAD